MKQGEIWLINLDPAIGAEIKKSRPAIVVNDNTLSEERFIKKIGRISQGILDDIKGSLSKVLTIESY
jgi:mRNA-degrading endonuclease toxin of MazEF toxin-antitoxin module